MKKRQWKYGFCVAILSVVALTACGDGSGGQPRTIPEEPVEIQEEPALSEEEQAIRDYELRYESGEFTMEDYHALAQLYGERGMIRRQRDLLEQSYRLYADAEAFELLQTISVNLAEEDASVQEEAAAMLQNLELEEYLAESVNLVCSQSWLETMMPKLYEGYRNYFQLRDGSPVLVIKAGYDQAGVADIRIWYLGADDQVTLLQRTGSAVSMLRTGMTDGAYQGGFESWLCDGATGDLYHEQGSFAGGLFTGEYSAAIHGGTEASDTYSLWSMREGMAYTVYTGTFDAQGATALEQPTEKILQKLLADSGSSTGIVYAYDEAGENALFVGAEEGTEPSAYVFRAEDMGWHACPDFAIYEVQNTTGGQDDLTAEDAGEDSADAGERTADSQATPQVRIFDGEIQIYLNNAWVNVGGVKQLEKEDPFRVYAQSRQSGAQAGNSDGAEADEGALTGALRRVSGSIPRETPTTSTQKPSTQKPAAQAPQPETPAVQPETPAQQPQEPQPSAPAQPSTPSQPSAPSTPSTPAQPSAPSTPSTPSESGGGDVDIEWTDDIL